MGFDYGVSRFRFSGRVFRIGDFAVRGVGLRVSRGFLVLCSRFFVVGVCGYGVSRFGFSDTGFRVGGFGYGISGSLFRVFAVRRFRSSWFRVQGFRGSGSLV